jgi:predicted phosphodiesterase
MRWALLADVHANLEALRAVMRDLEDWPDHRLICAGDIVGYGPDPEACLDLLLERQATCVSGNHEAMVLGRIGFDRCVYAGIVAAVWTRAHLTSRALERLAALPMVARPSPDIVVCHAVPDDVQRYVTGEGVAGPLIANASKTFPDAELLVGGHTHYAAFQGDAGSFRRVPPGTSEQVLPGRLHLVNPGSVGQPRDGRLSARYARYDSATRTIAWRSVSYDASPTIAKQRKARLVARVCYSFPQPWLERKLDVARTRWARARYRALPALPRGGRRESESRVALEIPRS